MKIPKHILIPTLEIIIGLILLVRELYQMTILPSIHDKSLELISFFKYKENTYSLIFVWLVVTIVGMLSLKRHKRMWISNQVLIIAILFGALIATVFSLIYKSPEGLIWGLVIIGILIIEYKYFKSNFTKAIKPSQLENIVCVSTGLFLALIFWIIELTRLSYNLFEVL